MDQTCTPYSGSAGYSPLDQQRSQTDATVIIFNVHVTLNKTGFNSMGPLTQTFSNSKYNSHTLSTLLEAVDVEEPSCQRAQRAVAL